MPENHQANKHQQLVADNMHLQMFVTRRRCGPDLDYASKVAVSRQLQALPLRPGLDGGEPLTESDSPVVGAQARSAGLRVHQLVEKPSADKMEELREELYGEGGVNPATAQKGHGVHQGVQHHLCNSITGLQGARGPGGLWTSGKRQAVFLTLPMPAGSEPRCSGSTRKVGR